MTSVNYTCSCPSGFTGMLCGTNTQGTSRAGLPPARSWLGTEPHTHRIWPTSFRLVVTLLTEHTYVRTYASTDCTGGVGEKFSQLLQAAKIVAFDFTHHGHALVTPCVYVLRGCPRKNR